MIQKIIGLMKKETVLFIAGILAVLSMFVVHPDRTYITYIDFRTLAILFCLMTIVAAFRNMGVFDRMAAMLLKQVKGLASVVLVMVLLCFFLSMVITNDVALITFVPLTIIVFRKLEETVRMRWMISCIVLQTVAANLGSMLTPIGNPQNLFLYGKALETGALKGMENFLTLMLPYSLCSLLLLLICIAVIRWFWRRDVLVIGQAQLSELGEQEKLSHRSEHAVVYVLLFGVSLLTVAHMIPYPISFLMVFIYVWIRDRDILKKVDYSLLATFVALFIFIGNLGRISVFRALLQQVIEGREMFTAVFASQVMSNVPAAVLLEKFTDRIPALIVGTNLGGLGTLIASMASLISYKYIVRENPEAKGTYMVLFSVVNVVFLVILCALAYYGIC